MPSRRPHRSRSRRWRSERAGFGGRPAMYLRSITLKGFKSFVDRTRLEFGPGVSVIVGPNGSGKSNITDAVLWALGEQSPVAVRGASMQDVIFGGAPGRQASRSAEVELVLDDADGVLGLGAPEISVLRKLDRAGEGEYRLAGARCRLIDVIELLSDTGLGKEMHSVISQGRVEAIVTSKPRDRRLLIEEAAGLGKHRKRRRRAQLKLGHTQDNLDRALDVEREARSRLRPLKRQAEAAELHARLHRQMLEVRWELARDELRAKLAEVESAQAEAAQARTARAELERELEAVAARRRAAEEALAARSAQREELSRRSYAAQSAADRIGYRTETVRSAADAVAARMQRGRDRLQALRAEAAVDLPDRAAAERVTALERELEALDRDRDAELARQVAELEAERSRAEQLERELAVEVERRAAERQAADAALEDARRAVHEAERAVEAARRESARVGGELAAVNQFLRSHASAPGGGRPLADALSVEPGYELAVAAALDGRLGAAVVEDREAAVELLGRSGPEGGRVLITRLASRAARTERRAAGPSGAERLAERVGGEDEVAELARALLDDAWVVEDLGAVAADFAGLAVTRDGRVFSPVTRELRQAPDVGEDRVLAERNRRDQLVAETERAVQAEQAARAQVESAGSVAGERESAREAASAAHRDAVGRRDEALEEARRAEAAIARRRAAPDEGPAAARRAQVQAELAAERAGLERGERERARRTQEIEWLAAATARDEAALPGIAAIAEELTELAAVIAECRSDFETALAADREAGEHVAAELRECAKHEAGLQARLHAASESLTALEVRAQRARDQAEDSRQVVGELAAELELEAAAAAEPLEEAARTALRDRLERLVRRREQLGPVNPLAADEYAEAVAYVEELEHQRGDLEAALRELEKLIRDTDRQIRETFEATFAAAARNFEELVGQLFPGGSGRLRLVSEQEGQAPVLGGQAAAEAELDAQADEDLLGVEIEITPGGKAMKRLTLLSGGEKSMTALAFLFAVFLAKPCPFYIMDEVEAALDDLNISRFLDLLDTYNDRAQFIVVTHQKRTMEAADSLYGVSMGGDGISKVISRRLPEREAV